MCNAHNHPLWCTCGFGGERPPTEPELAATRPRGSSYTWHAPEDFCRPTTCPQCGHSVFFIRHNGGSIWIEALGSPWPKHPCFVDFTLPRLRRELDVYPGGKLGIIGSAEVVEPGISARLIIQCHDGERVESTFGADWDMKVMPGRFVVVVRNGGSLTIYRV